MKLFQMQWVLGALCTSVIGCGEASPDDPSSNPHPLNLAGLNALAVQISGGMPNPYTKDCPVTSYAVELTSQELSSSYCALVPGSTNKYSPMQGSRLLSDAEMRAVNMVLANQLSTKASDNCGADKPDEELTLTYADHTATYWDDFYAGCPTTVPTGKTYIRGLDGLIMVLAGSSVYETFPTDFVTARFFVDPPAGKDLSARAACASYEDAEYSINASTQELSWQMCQTTSPGAAYATVSGSRILSNAEYASVLAGMGTLVLGASGDCSESRHLKSLEIDGTSGFVTFNNDVAACTAQAEARVAPFVVGLDALIDVVAGLAGTTN
jgi:hypothetical protein